MGLFSELHWEWNFFLLWNFQGIKYYFYMGFFLLFFFKYVHGQYSFWGLAYENVLLLLFSHYIMLNSLRLQHAMLLCPSLSSGVCSNISIELVMPSNHLILCHPLLLMPSIFPSIRDFFNELAVCIRWPKYWSFSFSISPSNEYSGLISFRMDWFDLLAVQGTPKSLLQHHSSKASFFSVQISL